MAIEDNLKNIINDLSKENKIRFGSACVHRFKSLYKYFDNDYDISLSTPILSKGDGYSYLVDILYFIDEKLVVASKDEINLHIQKNDPLIVDLDLYGSSVDTYVANLVAQSVNFILEFGKTENNMKIYYCIDVFLEILNQIKSEDFYKKNPTATDFELVKYLDIIFANEIRIEESLVDYISRNDYKTVKNIVMREQILKAH